MRAAALSFFAPVPKLFQLRHEAFRFRIGAFAAFLFEGLEQLFLFFAELRRCLDRDLDIEIAGHAATAQHRHALAAQAELTAGLRGFGDVHLCAAAVERRHFDAAAKCRLHERDRRAAIKIVSVALEDRVRRDRDEDVKIAGGSAVQFGLAFAGEADARAFLDAGRYVDGERTLLLHMALAFALLARIADDLSGTAALRAGAFDGEEAVLRAHLADTGTGRTLLGFRARFRTGTATTFASDRRRHGDLCGATLEGFFERDFEIVAKIAAAVLTAALFAAATELAEQIGEDVGEAGCEIERIAAAASAHALLEGGMAEAVIGRALLIVLQDVIGLVDFLEFDFGGVVAGILGGMEFHRELAEARLDLGDRGALLAVQDVVVIAFAHRPAE